MVFCLDSDSDPKLLPFVNFYMAWKPSLRARLLALNLSPCPQGTLLTLRLHSLYHSSRRSVNFIFCMFLRCFTLRGSHHYVQASLLLTLVHVLKLLILRLHSLYHSSRRSVNFIFCMFLRCFIWCGSHHYVHACLLSTQVHVLKESFWYFNYIAYINLVVDLWTSHFPCFLYVLGDDYSSIIN